MSNSIFDFPQDIIFNILSRLPAKSLLQFRCVCTSAPPLISHPSFTKLHLTSTVADDRLTIICYDSIDETNHYYSLLSPLTFHKTLNLQFPSYPRKGVGYQRFAGSNKGLICFFDSDYNTTSGTLIIWNPSINKYKILDGLHRLSDQCSLFLFGFGFVSRTCEFKVVGIVYDYGFYMNNIKRTGGRSCCNPVVDKNNTVFVYSLSTNSWEIKEGMSAPCYLTRDWSSTTFVNGFVNWLAYKEDRSLVIIMAFDLDNERFQVYDLPKNIAPYYRDPCLNSFGEEDSLSLSLCVRYHAVNVNKFDVWVMGEYGVVDSWKKVYVISNHVLSRPPLLMKNDREVLIVVNDEGVKLELFDAIKNEMQDFETLVRPGYLYVIRFTASLAMLHG